MSQLVRLKGKHTAQTAHCARDRIIYLGHNICVFWGVLMSTFFIGVLFDSYAYNAKNRILFGLKNIPFSTTTLKKRQNFEA